MRFSLSPRAKWLAPALLGSLMAVQVAQAQQPPAPPTNFMPGPQPGEYIMNFRDAPIRSVAEQVAAITGRTLIIDPAVSGAVTVVSNTPLKADGVWQLFQSSLRVNGFVAVQAGSNWRIIPQNLAMQAAAGGAGARSQDFVTRVIPLSNLPAESAQRVLKPLINAAGGIEPLQSPNAIIVTDYAENVSRIEQLAKQMDTGRGSQVEIIPVANAAARDIAPVLERVSGSADGGGSAGAPRIAVDERSNMLLVRGTPEAIQQIKGIVAALDVPGGAQPVTRVFRLANSDAEFVTDILRGLSGGAAASTNPVARSLAPTRTGGSGVGSGMAPPSTGPAGVLQSIAAAPVGATGIVNTAAPSAASGDIAIQAAKEINAVVVRGLPSQITAIATLIEELDVRRPQVLIEAAIVEITGDAVDALGLQFGTANGPSRGVIAATSFSTSGPSLQSILTALGEPAAVGLTPEGLAIGASNGNGFNILVQALSRSSKANLLSTPSLTTLDNEPAQIVVGQNVPFRTGSFATSGNSRDPFTTIERQDVGITLQVVPRLYEGDVVRLEVSQEVSSLVDSTIAGAADLITNRRSIQTAVLADNGQTIVLGGLITDDRTSAKGKVPLLGDIPLVGKLFGSERKSRTRRTLFVFLRPTILRNAHDAAIAAQAKYDRLREDEAASAPQGIFLAGPPPRLEPAIEGVYQDK